MQFLWAVAGWQQKCWRGGLWRKNPEGLQARWVLSVSPSPHDQCMTHWKGSQGWDWCGREEFSFLIFCHQSFEEVLNNYGGCYSLLNSHCGPGTALGSLDMSLWIPNITISKVILFPLQMRKLKKGRLSEPSLKTQASQCLSGMEHRIPMTPNLGFSYHGDAEEIKIKPTKKSHLCFWVELINESGKFWLERECLFLIF